MRRVYVMVKVPQPGRVKTRLARDIGPIDAAWWFRHQVAELIRRLGADTRWQVHLAVSPDHAGMLSRAWRPDLPRMGQGHGDLGRRMMRVFRAAPPGPAVIIGGDIPGVAPSHIAQAFAALDQSASVFGPASDGGYWLIGVRRCGPHLSARLLDGVRWSGPHALSDSQARVAVLGTSACITTLDDVDTGADLAAIRKRAPMLR